jgi:Cdc6-like AAA superfamily ATPase
MNNAIQLPERINTYFVTDNVHINKNGALTAIFQLSPINELNVDENGFEGISWHYYELLKQLPAYTEIQFLYDKYQTLNNDPSSSFSTTNDEEVKYLSDLRSEHINSTNYYQIDIFLSVTFNHLVEKTKHSVPFSTFFLDNKKPAKITKPNFLRDLSEVNSLCETIQNYFSYAAPYRLNTTQIIKLLSNFYNFESDFEEEVYVSDEYFTRDLFKYAYGVDKTGFSVGKDFISVISMYELPTSIVCPIIVNENLKSPLHSFLNVNGSFRLIINASKADQKKAPFMLDKQMKLFKSLATFNSLSKRKAEELEGFDGQTGLIEDIELEQDLLFELSINVLFKSDTKEEAKKREDQFLSTFSAFNGAKAIVEAQDALNVFMGCSPGNFLNATRYFPIRGSGLCTLLNLTSEFQGHETGITYQNRDSKVILYDIFDSETNYNGFIVGPSGKGKSFTMNDIIKKYYEQGVKFVILDVGGSYIKLVEQFKGDYIDINVENPTYIDPFYYFNPNYNDGKEYATSISLIQSFIEIMLLKSDVDQTNLPKDHKGVINKTIEQFFKIHQEATSIHHYHSFLLSNDDFFKDDLSVRNYALRVIEYYINSFKAFFDPKNENKLSLESNKSLICYDLVGIEGLPDLQPLFAFLITNTVSAINNRDKNKFIFVMDEAWKFLQQSERIAQYAEEALRTFRKMNGSIILITQNIRDLEAGKIKDAMVNCNTKWLLHHDKDHDIVRESLNISDNELRAFKNLRFDSKKRELMISSNSEPVVVSIAFSAHDMLMSSTKPSDLIKIEKYKNENGGSLIKAIDTIVKEDL